MNLLQIINIGIDKCYWLLSLANEQFLINTSCNKKFFLIDKNGQLMENINYDHTVECSPLTALINEKCLVIHTGDPDELRFYDL